MERINYKIMKVEEMFATDTPEFFYKEDDSVVLEGEHIGHDVEMGNNTIELVLNDNIYWNPDASVEQS